MIDLSFFTTNFVINNLAMWLGFFFLGASLKYIDAFYDDKVFNKSFAYALSVIAGVVMGYFIYASPYSASIFLAVILGVAIAGKIDKPGFIIGAVLALIIPTILAIVSVNNGLTLTSVTLNFDALLLAVLLVAGVIDEFGNNLIDKRKKINSLVQTFFAYRLMMQVAMLFLVIAQLVKPEYWIAFIFFDSGYHIITYYARKEIRRQSTHLIRGI